MRRRASTIRHREGISKAVGACERGSLLATLLANLDGLVFRCLNDSDWTMLSVSAGCFALTGYRASDLLLNRGLTFSQMIHPDDKDRVREAIETALAERSRRLPIDCLKIDRSLTSEVDRDAGAAAIAQAVISLGHILGCSVLAEGVETPGQLAFLRAKGCDQAQGHLLSRPQSVTQFAETLAANLPHTTFADSMLRRP